MSREIRMNKNISMVRLAVSVVALVPVLAALQLLVFSNVPNSEFYMPHGHCFLWQPGLLALHAGSDTLIGLSYIVISAALGILVYRAQRDIPLPWIFVAFGLFIVACGATHLFEVLTLWDPVYWLSGGVKVVTAVASVATAIVLPPLVPRIVSMVRDVRLSEQRKEELEVLYKRLKELDDVKTEFFANVSHELRTPLALILGPTQRMLADEAIDDLQRSDLQVIERNARLLLRHVNDLLDISRMEAGRLQPQPTTFDLAALVRRLTSHFQVLADERSIDYRIEAPAPVNVELDTGMVERIVLNVLSNAFKFTPDGGLITCEVRTDGSDVVVEVCDSGPGIRPEDRPTVFERFRQVAGSSSRRSGGTGLGLAIAREFVELHGGRITIADSPHGGACFTIHLPAHPEYAAATTISTPPTGESDELARTAIESLRSETPHRRSEPSAVDSSGSGEAQPDSEQEATVLVVEDNPEMNRFIVETLELDYVVHAAFDGDEGLRSARQLRPDLVLTDLMMPNAGGESLIRRLREDHSFDTTPVMVLSARAGDEMLINLLRTGAQDYLVKPMLADELRARAANLIMMKRVREVLQSAVDSRSDDIELLASRLSENKTELEAALAARDRFLAVLSHELRTPLTPVLTAAHALVDDPDLPADTRELMEIVRTNAEIEALLIDDLLDLSRLRSGKLSLKLERIDIDTLVHRAVDTIRSDFSDRDIVVDVHLDAKDNVIEADAARMQQILWNLLKNAAKFSETGGLVMVTSDNPDQSTVRITVEDQGIGIERDLLPKIFDAFQQGEQTITRRYGGLGLGLSICRMLADLHGATLEAHSDGPGMGSRFELTMPIATAQEEPA